MLHKIFKFSPNYLLLFLIFLLFISNNKVKASSEPLVRVLIARQKNLRIRSDGKIPLVLKNKEFQNKQIKGITIKTIDNKKIFFFDKHKSKFNEFNKKGLVIHSIDRRGIWVGDKRYSGKLKILNINDEIFVINILGIEQYLSSVVGSEMPYKWPLEALKAQAIASRTYALKKTGNDLFDLDSTQKDQVYNGLESKKFKTIKAVRDTRSLVIVHNNKLINALFHSSSGGMTENSEDVWKNKYPYLKSTKDFDSKNPKLMWKKKFKNKDLENLFPTIGGIENIKILKITNSGRIKNLKIFGQYGAKEISGTEIRKKLGLKSTLFRFKFANKSIKYQNNKDDQVSLFISGMGAGHGVGMSQWGAKYLAYRGFKARGILKHFYKGIQVKPFKDIYK